MYFLLWKSIFIASSFFLSLSNKLKYIQYYLGREGRVYTTVVPYHFYLPFSRSFPKQQGRNSQTFLRQINIFWCDLPDLAVFIIFVNFSAIKWSIISIQILGEAGIQTHVQGGLDRESSAFTTRPGGCNDFFNFRNIPNSSGEV